MQRWNFVGQSECRGLDRHRRADAAVGPGDSGCLPPSSNDRFESIFRGLLKRKKRHQEKRHANRAVAVGVQWVTV